jgi:rod shape-determining protein MreB
MRDLLFTPVGYVQIFRNRVRLSIPSKGVVVEELGDFSHPRSILGQFVVGEQTLAKAVAKAYPGKLLKPRPALIVQPMELLEGGLTQIEERALLEMALGAGASQVRIWQGPDLSPEQIASFSFKTAV